MSRNLRPRAPSRPWQPVPVHTPVVVQVPPPPPRERTDRPAERPAGGRDVRYPRITPAELAARGPEVIALPDEPHPFSDADAQALAAAVPAARVVRADGKDLFWYGAWTIEALPRLRTAAASW